MKKPSWRELTELCKTSKDLPSMYRDLDEGILVDLVRSRSLLASRGFVPADVFVLPIHIDGGNRRLLWADRQDVCQVMRGFMRLRFFSRFTVVPTRPAEYVRNLHASEDSSYIWPSSMSSALPGGIREEVLRLYDLHRNDVDMFIALLMDIRSSIFEFKGIHAIRWDGKRRQTSAEVLWALHRYPCAVYELENVLQGVLGLTALGFLGYLSHHAWVQRNAWYETMKAKVADAYTKARREMEKNDMTEWLSRKDPHWEAYNLFSDDVRGKLRSSEEARDAWDTFTRLTRERLRRAEEEHRRALLREEEVRGALQKAQEAYDAKAQLYFQPIWYGVARRAVFVPRKSLSTAQEKAVAEAQTTLREWGYLLHTYTYSDLSAKHENVSPKEYEERRARYAQTLERIQDAEEKLAYLRRIKDQRVTIDGLSVFSRDAKKEEDDPDIKVLEVNAREAYEAYVEVRRQLTLEECRLQYLSSEMNKSPLLSVFRWLPASLMSWDAPTFHGFGEWFTAKLGGGDTYPMWIAFLVAWAYTGGNVPPVVVQAEMDTEPTANNGLAGNVWNRFRHNTSNPREAAPSLRLHKWWTENAHDTLKMPLLWSGLALYMGVVTWSSGAGKAATLIPRFLVGPVNMLGSGVYNLVCFTTSAMFRGSVLEQRNQSKHKHVALVHEHKKARKLCIATGVQYYQRVVAMAQMGLQKYREQHAVTNLKALYNEALKAREILDKYFVPATTHQADDVLREFKVSTYGQRRLPKDAVARLGESETALRHAQNMSTRGASVEWLNARRVWLAQKARLEGGR